MQYFTNAMFKKYSDFIFHTCGIKYRESKKTQLEIKIRKAMAKSGYDSFEEYYSMLENSEQGQLLQVFINFITTNTTEFFREKEHFDFIEKNISKIIRNNSAILKNKEIRVWCAASSTGQEPVTVAITLNECLEKDITIKILATDIDSNVLKVAASGIYTATECSGIPKSYLNKYFECIDEEHCRTKRTLLELIRYRQFNLMNDFNFKKEFDIIFCRNVMIYFDRDTQEELIQKFYQNLAFGGYLFVGHTESLMNKSHDFICAAPSVYYKLNGNPDPERQGSR